MILVCNTMWPQCALAPEKMAKMGLFWHSKSGFAYTARNSRLSGRHLHFSTCVFEMKGILRGLSGTPIPLLSKHVQFLRLKVKKEERGLFKPMPGNHEISMSIRVYVCLCFYLQMVLPKVICKWALFNWLKRK